MCGKVITVNNQLCLFRNAAQRTEQTNFLQGKPAFFLQKVLGEGLRQIEGKNSEKNECEKTQIAFVFEQNSGRKFFSCLMQRLRRQRIDEDGQYWDELDGRPFSTEFSHSRFLVPEIARRNNLTGWVLYCDCDFLFLSDVCEVFNLCDDKYAVMCVQHDYHPEDGVKMDNMVQQDYAKKLWSSFVLYNLDHPANDKLDEVMVNNETGANLHKFSWLDSDEQIGSIPPKEVATTVIGWFHPRSCLGMLLEPWNRPPGAEHYQAQG